MKLLSYNSKGRVFSMKDSKVKIMQRLNNMKKFYIQAGNMIDNLPDSIPKDTKKMLKEKILGDEELKELMNGIDQHRPPRLFLIGRTGVGKSSLINAIVGSYVAKVSDTVSCTPEATSYEIKEDERVLMEILDTRGIAESERIDNSVSAEDKLLEQVNEFSPDAVIFMLNCTHRDDVDKDVAFLKRVKKEYEEINQINLPIVVVINKCDEMAPARKKNPEDYSGTKLEKIKEVLRSYKSIIVKSGLKIQDIVAVSSLIDWQTPDGEEIAVEDIDNLPENDIKNLEIAFDGRYNIEELLNILDGAILDAEARMGLRMAVRLNELVKRIAKQIEKTFSTIGAGVALTPIPLSDIYILLLLQTVMVSLIAALSGRDIDLDTAKEFVLSLGGMAGAGVIFRLIAQQASKLLNGLFPGSGSAVSSVIAAAGTMAIGEAAIKYYIDEASLDEAKEQFIKTRDEKTSKATS